MTPLLTYPDIDPQQWQALIDRSPYATWFQTKEAYEFYASVSSMQAFAYGVAEEGRLVGVIVGYTTKSTNAIQQYFTKRAINLALFIFASLIKKRPWISTASKIHQ